MKLKTLSFITGCFILYLIVCIIGFGLLSIICYIFLDEVIYEVSLMYGLMFASMWFLLNIEDTLKVFEEAWSKR